MRRIVHALRERCIPPGLSGGIKKENDMFVLLKNNNSNRNQIQTHKREISLTGALMEILRPGLPAMYLYQGNLICTSTVLAILEASASHVRFETQNSIYTISYNNQPGESFHVTA